MTRFLKSLNNVSEEYLEKCFGNERIYCIASGQMNDEIKFYLHAKHVNDNKISILLIIIIYIIETYR